jgi:hypothetical protein
LVRPWVTHMVMVGWYNSTVRVDSLFYSPVSHFRTALSSDVQAFSINLYNLMIQYAFVKVGIGTTDLTRASFFSSVSFQLGPDLLSLKDLEHGVLRGNRRAPHSIAPQFSRKDPRIALSMPKVDYRIHFALNCGVRSSPLVRELTVDDIDLGLSIMGLAFCEDDNNVRVGNEHLHLSSIFNWYKEDFGGESMEVAKTIAPFLRGEKKLQLENLLGKGSIKIKYNKYDWSTNASDFLPFSAGNVKANVFRTS